MVVAGGYSKVVLLRGCGDPDVVFRNWSTFVAKKILDFSVMLSCCGVATENSVCRRELIHCLNVRLDASGLSRTAIQLTENMLEANTSAASVTRCLTAGSSAKRAITIFVSRRNLPLAKIHRFTAFFNRIAHSLKIVWRYAAGEREEIGAGNSIWLNFSEFPSEIQHALLLCFRKPMKQFGNLLINGGHGMPASFFRSI